MTYWLCWIQNLPDQNKPTHPHPSDLPSTHPPDLPYYLTYPPTYHYNLQDSDICSQIWPYQTYLTYPNTWPTYPPGLRTHLTYPPAWHAHLHSTITFRIQHCLKDNCQDLLLLPFPPTWHTQSIHLTCSLDLPNRQHRGYGQCWQCRQLPICNCKTCRPDIPSWPTHLPFQLRHGSFLQCFPVCCSQHVPSSLWR